jgi:hypothetical protein
MRQPAPETYQQWDKTGTDIPCHGPVTIDEPCYEDDQYRCHGGEWHEDGWDGGIKRPTIFDV